MSKKSIGLFVGLATIVASLGCATAPPSQELVDARAVYARAQNGLAARYALVQLHDAQLALDRAEAAYRDEPNAPASRDLAYIAVRRAQLADVEGQTEFETRIAHSTAAERTTLLAQLNAREREQIGQIEARLNAEQTARAQAEGQAQQANEQAAQATQSLEQEQEARANAERAAQAAVASLERVANAREEERGLVITLNGAVLFATGQATLLPIAEQRLDEVAHALADLHRCGIVVEGHTDNRGSTQRNEELSQRRADAVTSYLIAHGVAANAVHAVGYGPSRPVADNTSPEGRANNRRVEIVVAPPSASGEDSCVASR